VLPTNPLFTLTSQHEISGKLITFAQSKLNSPDHNLPTRGNKSIEQSVLWHELKVVIFTQLCENYSKGALLLPVPVFRFRVSSAIANVARVLAIRASCFYISKI